MVEVLSTEARVPSSSVNFLRVRRVKMVTGAANTLHVSCVQVVLSLSEEAQGSAESLRSGLRRFGSALGVPVLPRETATSPTAGTLVEDFSRQWSSLLSGALSEVNASLSQSVSAPLRLLPVQSPDPGSGRRSPAILVEWPTLWPHLMVPVLDWALDQWLALAEAADEDAAVSASRSSWQQVREKLVQALPTGVNTARILAAAAILKLPVQWVDRDVMQLGQGRRARWLRSTLTDATPSLGVGLARDKARAARLLRMAGVAVPQHVEVASETAALAAAERLGWPVVVKPADQDGGAGARANLRDSEQVAAAYRHASTVSKRVLVEQHIAGNEYRLTVVHGRLFWAHERVPATVVGDGRSSLQALIDAENERRRLDLLADPGGLVPIRITDENLLWLQKAGWNLVDAPAAGQSVRLQSVPHAAHGGSTHACLDNVHPDNRLLAERVAQLLRLDVAGIDLIIPDISQSWREIGGAVTEVNAIPQISTLSDRSLVVRLIQQLVPGQGRIPLVYILARGDAPPWVELLHERLGAAGLRVGLSTDAGLRLGADWIRTPRDSVWADVKALQLDPTVGAIVVVSDGMTLLQSGLPFDAVNALVVAAHAPQVLHLLAPYCSGLKAVFGEGVARQYGKSFHAQARDWLVMTGSSKDERRLVDEVARAVLDAETAYAQR